MLFKKPKQLKEKLMETDEEELETSPIKQEQLSMPQGTSILLTDSSIHLGTSNQQVKLSELSSVVKDLLSNKNVKEYFQNKTNRNYIR